MHFVDSFILSNLNVIYNKMLLFALWFGHRLLGSNSATKLLQNINYLSSIILRIIKIIIIVLTPMATVKFHKKKPSTEGKPLESIKHLRPLSQSWNVFLLK